MNDEKGGNHNDFLPFFRNKDVFFNSPVKAVERTADEKCIPHAKEMHVDTLRHHGRVAETGRILGRALGLNPEALGLLVDCAARHDVGKQFIPRDILHKPGPLEPSEWDVMKGHTWRGAEYLVERTEVNESWLIALTHHERFDGRGYPFGLCGTDIPLFSRIVSLADMFDALISERCYKPAYSVALSLDIIRSERGHRFDPCIVDVFLAHVDEIGCMN